MVDPQAVHDPVPYQFEDLGVGGGEHLRVLHPHPDQLRDGEEPPVVQLGAGQPPPAEPVVLGVQQLGQVEVCGAGPQRELLLAVAEHVPVDPQPVDLLAQPSGEDGQQDPPVARVPVDVEPAGVRGAGPLAQDLAQRVVVPGVGGHVVRHDVQDEAEPVFAGDARQPAQPLLAAQLGAHPAVVDDVVAVP